MFLSYILFCKAYRIYKIHTRKKLFYYIFSIIMLPRTICNIVKHNSSSARRKGYKCMYLTALGHKKVSTAIKYIYLEKIFYLIFYSAKVIGYVKYIPGRNYFILFFIPQEL